jgi:glutaredoxin 3
MASIEIYSVPACSYCVRAKQLLAAKGVAFTEYDCSVDDAAFERIRTLTTRKTFPQIFINGEGIGGFDELSKLERDGDLDRMLAAGDTSV